MSRLTEAPGTPTLRILDARRKAIAGERVGAQEIADEPPRPIMAMADPESDLARRFGDLEAALR